MRRTAFFISDSTGITAETLGTSLLAQFEGIEFRHVILSYIDSEEKARGAVERIDRTAEQEGVRPLIFDTIVNRQVREIVAGSRGFTVDVLATFLAPLEQELGSKSSFTVGRSHTMGNDASYKHRIDAVNYALDNDDGMRVNRFEEAELILLGVSRSGKTPTSLYLALQTGVFVANYPLTEEDLEHGRLPRPLQAHRDKLYGLTIHPERLAVTRSERRPNSRYASLRQCEDEVRMAEALYRRFAIPFLETTQASVEEIATRILSDTELRGHAK